MPIAIHALASHLPASSEHTSLLGSVVRSAYNHLYHPAGRIAAEQRALRPVEHLDPFDPAQIE